MNIVKKIAVVVAFLCATTVVNAEEGIKFGARVGYSLQMLGAYDMGLFGVQAGVAVNIPVASQFAIAPEVAFIYRNNYTYEGVVDFMELGDITQPEMAISVPIVAKYAFADNMYVGAGVQVDLPLGAEQCKGDKCEPMDGKEIEVDGVKTGAKNPERATIDLGIPIVFGYNIMPNLAVDFRYVWGLLAHSKYTLLGVELKSDALSSMGVNATYFF